MKMHNRFVFDTNTLISAALFRTSIPRQAVDKALLMGSLLVSESTSLEIVTVLLRTKFDRYLEREKRELFLASFLQQTQLIAISETILACRDAKDDKFLEVAVNGKADVIVTGDDDLLVLHPFRTIFIVTPRDFVDHF
jgi:putative PIN family toxin of toxin-antitoxin system